MIDKESHLRNNEELCFGQLHSKSIVGLHWRSSHERVGRWSSMRSVKQARTKQISGRRSSKDRNESQKGKDEHMGKQEETALLKTS